MAYGGAQGLSPGSESCHDEIVQTAYETARQKSFGAVSTAFPAYENLGCRRRLRERILPVHLLDEILPERDQEEDAQHSAQQRGQEHLPEIHLHTQYIYGRKSEYGSGDHRS